MHHAVKSSPMDAVESIFGEKIALRVRGLQARGITSSSFQRCQWKANNIPQAVQPVMTFQDLYSFRRNLFRKSEIVDFDHAKMEVFWEKRPLTGKFSQMFSKAPTEHTETRLSVQIS